MRTIYISLLPTPPAAAAAGANISTTIYPTPVGGKTVTYILTYYCGSLYIYPLPTHVK